MASADTDTSTRTRGIKTVQEALEALSKAEAGQPAARPISSPYYSLTEWIAGKANCDGKPVDAVWTETPSPTIASPDSKPGDVVLSFSIDATGRPVSIRFDTRPRDGKADVGILLAAAGVEGNPDLEPAMATWRFAPGTVRNNCSIRFSRKTETFEQAPDVAVLQIATMGWLTSPVLAGPVLDKFRVSRSSCPSMPIPRIIHYPALDEMPLPAGRMSVSLYRFDVAPDGRTSGVRSLASNAPEQIVAATTEAMRASSYKANASRQGCLASVLSRPVATMSPPPVPPPATFRQPDSNCPASPNGLLSIGSLEFPPSYQVRAIEGWAVVRFDIESDGKVTSVVALESQPTSEFGQQAEKVLRSSRGPTGQHYKDCVTRVLYSLADTPAPVTYGGAIDGSTVPGL